MIVAIDTAARPEAVIDLTLLRLIGSALTVVLLFSGCVSARQPTTLCEGTCS
jgi:hypothetical protein